MTFKDRLEIEHPGLVYGGYIGSCSGCPDTYDYESKEESLEACKKKCCDECWNREIPVDDFKVGDKVRLKKNLVVGGIYFSKPQSSVKLLKGMVFDGVKEVTKLCDYGSVVLNYGFYYNPLMLEKIEEERKEDMIKKVEFTRDNLKDGNMIKTRSGDIYMWILEKPRSYYGSIGHTRNDLKNGLLEKYDIVEVRDASKIEASTIGQIFDKYEELPIIWKEKDEEVTKDVSMEELNALLKEKYPDVDTFNLPIKEK